MSCRLHASLHHLSHNEEPRNEGHLALRDRKEDGNYYIIQGDLEGLKGIKWKLLLMYVQSEECFAGHHKF